MICLFVWNPAMLLFFLTRLRQFSISNETHTSLESDEKIDVSGCGRGREGRAASTVADKSQTKKYQTEFK